MKEELNFMFRIRVICNSLPILHHDTSLKENLNTDVTSALSFNCNVECFSSDFNKCFFIFFHNRWDRMDLKRKLRTGKRGMVRLPADSSTVVVR